MKAAYCTLGCKVNQYDTQAIQEMLEKEGYETVDFTDVADVYVINTCTVTHIGDKKSRQMISRAHTLAPDAYIVVVGCYSQRAPEEVKQLPGVSLVIGTKDRTNIVEMIKSLHKGDNAVNAVSDIRSETEFEELCAVREGKTRAQLKIQDGCDRFCTYCAIPYARGPIRSRKLDNIKKELEKLQEEMIDLAETFRKNLPFEEESYRCEADVFKLLHKSKEEEDILRLALNELKIAPKCALRLADLLFERGDYSEALPLIQRGLRDAIQTQRTINEGYLYYLMGLTKMALAQQAGAPINEETACEIYADFDISLRQEHRAEYVNTMKAKTIVLVNKSGVSIPEKYEELNYLVQ